MGDTDEIWYFEGYPDNNRLIISRNVYTSRLNNNIVSDIKND